MSVSLREVSMSVIDVPAVLVVTTTTGTMFQSGDLGVTFQAITPPTLPVKTMDWVGVAYDGTIYVGTEHHGAYTNTLTEQVHINSTGGFAIVAAGLLGVEGVVKVSEQGNEFLSATPDDGNAVLGLNIPTETASEIEGELKLFKVAGQDGSGSPVSYTTAGVTALSVLSFVQRFDKDTADFLDVDMSKYTVGNGVIVGAADDSDTDYLFFGVFL